MYYKQRNIVLLCGKFYEMLGLRKGVVPLRVVIRTEMFWL